MIEFITGASGSGKSTVMFSRISAMIEKNKDICIIVPEQFSYDFDKKLYHHIGAAKFNCLTSLSFTGLSRELFQLYGETARNGEYADEFARMILIHLAISSTQEMPESMQYFRKISSRPGFAEEMLKLITEMKRSGISPEILKIKSASFDNKLMSKISDTASIYLEYERLMREYGYKDNLDDLKEASEIAAYHRYFCGKSVFIDEFESFTGDQLNFIKTIIASAENVCITLRTDDVNAGEFTLFETVNRTYRAIVEICREINKKFVNTACTECYRFDNYGLEYLSKNILRNRKKASEKAPDSRNITIFEAKDPYSEAEYVCATIRRMIFADNNLRYRDIAVISNTINGYAEVLKPAFERYDIPYFLSIERSVLHTSLMIFFSTLLDIMSRKKYSSELIFRFLKCRLLGIDLTDISMLENYCYKWSIDEDAWTESFTAPDDNLEMLNNLRIQIITPLEALRSRLDISTSAIEICKSLYNFLEKCGAEHYTSVLINNLIKDNRDYEAAEIKRLWGCLIDILDSTADTLKENTITFSKISSIIKSMIGRINYSVPPQTLDSVTAASARTARLSSPKIVFVLGANEGDFPNMVKLGGLFSEADKQKMSENGIEISRSLTDIIASERLVVYKSLSSASQQLFISYPLSDLSGQAKYPASVIGDILSLFKNNEMLITEPQLTPDYYAVTMKSAFYHYMRNTTDNGKSTASIKKLLSEDSVYKRKIEHIFMRSQRKSDFRISTEIMEKLKEFAPLRISPSGFEMYNICHFRYFCRECLRLFVCEKVELDSRFTGNLIHSCYYKIISSRSRDEFIMLPYEKLQNEISASAAEFRNSEIGEEFQRNPRFELSFNKLTERLVKVFVHTQQELMASSFVPADFEVNLRDKWNNTSLELEYDEQKRKLNFGGIIDRVDTCTIGDKKYVRIIDYKSGKKNLDAVTLSNGINMQMLLYLFCITENNNLYSGYVPAGVLYSPVSIKYVKSEDKRAEEINMSAIDNSLRASGLVINDRNLLEAMEHNISGRYVPVKLDKNNRITKTSECITSDGLEKLRKFSYKKLIEMANSLHSGDTSAVPLIINGKNAPCDYCEFINVCGNSSLSSYRLAEELVLPEISEILEEKTEKGDAENEMDQTAE